MAGLVFVGYMGVFNGLSAGPSDAEPANARPPETESELRYWLENMVWYHSYSIEEIRKATGLEREAIQEALDRFEIGPSSRPERSPDSPLRVLPYPGGRHPRIGFKEGAIDPQRETKVSVFTPWDESGYVVLDIPEAIWCQDGLLYLAHTHIDTLWTEQGIDLKPLEWRRHSDGTLTLERTLPNQVRFGTKVIPTKESVRMEMWLQNGSSETLRDLRVQNCTMLKAAPGFSEQTNENKVMVPPYAACRSQEENRWLIFAWSPCDRTWGNPPVPCMHSDPKFPDCPPGATRRLRGWFSFYEGTDVRAEFERIERTGWRDRSSR